MIPLFYSFDCQMRLPGTIPLAICVQEEAKLFPSIQLRSKQESTRLFDAPNGNPPLSQNLLSHVLKKDSFYTIKSIESIYRVSAAHFFTRKRSHQSITPNQTFDALLF
jgi:hypothetical protein